MTDKKSKKNYIQCLKKYSISDLNIFLFLIRVNMMLNHSHKRKDSLETCTQLCYCKTFLLVPDPTECTKFFLLKSAVHYLCNLKTNHIIVQRKTEIQKNSFIHD